MFTHNHPADVSLSVADVVIASKHGMAEMRAVSKSADYSISPAAGGKWPSSARIQTNYLTAKEAVGSALRAGVAAGRLTRQAANAVYSHRIWESIAPKLGLKYSRTPVK